MYKTMLAILILLLAANGGLADSNDCKLIQINATHWGFETTQTALPAGTHNYQAFANNLSSDYRTVYADLITQFSVRLTARHGGTVGNTIATTETGANTSFAQTTLTGGADTDLSGAWAEDTMPTGSGLWGDVSGMIIIAMVIGIVAIIIGYMTRI